ncbi:alanine dehydrogenase [uncultured Marinococcus sp.]|uniref:alanine dehydrogenase n=1 Tax=uncultured Marinococcus sp. TaxID=487012 RepID=UPI002601CB7E|nr:alanine dehydrogenase [uncultured Marinococcus sp.]
MRIGIPREIKNNEKRVAIIPSMVEELVSNGNEVFVETKAGEQSGFNDIEFESAGAEIIKDTKKVWDCEMVMKVKEPLPEEYQYFRENLILFTYLHLAAEPSLTDELQKNKVTAIAYETLALKDGSLPLLTPMSEIAGRMSVQIGARFLEGTFDGKGVLLGGIPGVAPATVTIIGGGVVGVNAAKIAIGLGAHVKILDVSAKRLREIDDQFSGRVETLMSNPQNLSNAVASADLLIGAVLIAGAKAPQIVKESMVKAMKANSVIVDVAVDQGGCIETIDKITTHENPVYLKHEVVHYAVANIPGSVSRTATLALTNATAIYANSLATLGIEKALIKHPELQSAINIHDGNIIHPAIAEAHKKEFVSFS